jgi:hypothetical protein
LTGAPVRRLFVLKITQAFTSLAVPLPFVILSEAKDPFRCNCPQPANKKAALSDGLNF